MNARRVPTKRWRFNSGEVGTYIDRMAGKTEQTFMSELIVGELVANTVAHAPGLVDLTIEWTHEDAVLTVSDSGPGLRTLHSDLPADLLHEGSRGLFLVHVLSARVTVATSRAGGAEIRVVLPIKLAPDRARSAVVGVAKESKRPLRS
jgi:anti-sigma regulatory factor (Ser/Thr protein kinase)